MGTTSENAGPAECAQAQAVARPMSRNLDNQLVRGTESHVKKKSHGTNLTAWVRSTMRIGLAFLALMTFSISLNGAVDTASEAERSPQVDYFSQEKNRQVASERQEQFRIRVSIQHAVGDNVPHAFPKNSTASSKQIPAQPRSDSDGIVLQGILLIIAMILTVILAVRILAPEFFRAVIKKLKPWAGDANTAAGLADKVRAEDEAFAQFLTTFQAGTTASPVSRAMDSSERPEAGEDDKKFYANAARLITTQRSLLQSIISATSDAARIRMLADLRREMSAFKVEAVSPEFLPAWQVATALEGLLKQLSDKVGNATHSTLRTVAGAVDLLAELSKPGVKKDILTTPPLKFLAVDDDMISRTAVSMALKKALNQPELADSGIAALSLAAKNAYDVVFLDVQMPGMDGFELCSKLHETSANKDTPVVFVTCMSDFDARAQSILTGGSDIIGKPFLTFEITVKALTLALGRRLRVGSEVVIERDAQPSTARLLPDSASPDDLSVTTNITPAAIAQGVADTSEQLLPDTDNSSLVIHNQAEDIADADNEPCDELEDAFLTRATTQLEALKNLIRSTSETTDEITRQEMLSEFYLGLHALSPEIDSDVSHPAMRVSSALEGLIRKLLESPANWTSSMLLTITNAVDLMDDLCAAGPGADLGEDSPIHILAVDDDPISRRAIVGALQMAFEKPESVENGEAALALATQQPFDLIFMDVQMPGMDGFETCSRIRQTKANGKTPIVFVTGQADSKTRSQVATSGGNGLIAKPFLTAEVTVKALTFALRGRLEKSIPANTSHKTEARLATESRRARNRRRDLQVRQANSH